MKPYLPFNAIITLMLSLLVFSSCKTNENDTGNRISVRLAAEPDRLNYLLSSSGYSSQVSNYIFYSLQAYDPADLKLKPLLIEQAPEVSLLDSGPFEGGASYTFEIREEADWGDGVSVKASDYLFTHKVIWNPALRAPHRNWLDMLQDIRIDPTNPRRFTVFTNTVYFLAEEMLSTIPLLPEHIYDPEGLMQPFTFSELKKMKDTDNENLKKYAELFKSTKYSHQPAGVRGCGPYELQTWDKGQSLLLKKKENWWGTQLQNENNLLKAIPREIEFKIIKDNTAAIVSLKAGALDVMSEIEPASFSEMLNNDFVRSQYELHTPPYLSYTYLGLNSRQPQLADRRVRKAVAHLLDIDQAIDAVLYQLGERVSSPIHPSKASYHTGLQPIPFDIETSKRLLAEAGWSDSDKNGCLDKSVDGQKTELRLSIKYSAANQTAASILTLFKETAAKAGVHFELEPLEFNTLIKEYRARNFDLVYSSWSQLPGADDFHQIWHTDSDTPTGANRTGFGDAASDAIIDSIALTLDEETRNQLYLSIQKRIYEEQTYIFLYAPLERIAISRKYKAKTSALRPGYFVNQFEKNK